MKNVGWRELADVVIPFIKGIDQEQQRQAEFQFEKYKKKQLRELKKKNTERGSSPSGEAPTNRRNKEIQREFGWNWKAEKQQKAKKKIEEKKGGICIAASKSSLTYPMHPNLWNHAYLSEADFLVYETGMR